MTADNLFIYAHSIYQSNVKLRAYQKIKHNRIAFVIFCFVFVYKGV